MKTLAELLMMTNAELFFFGGVQHADVSVGRCHESLIIPASIHTTLINRITAEVGTSNMSGLRTY